MRFCQNSFKNKNLNKRKNFKGMKSFAEMLCDMKRFFFEEIAHLL